ncbi:MAG: hypothetical protein Q9173_003230 [Seirophora scorigena]
MATKQPSRVRQALEALTTLSEHELESHWPEVEKAIRELTNRVRDRIPTTIGDCSSGLPQGHNQLPANPGSRCSFPGTSALIAKSNSFGPISDAASPIVLRKGTRSAVQFSTRVQVFVSKVVGSLNDIRKFMERSGPCPMTSIIAPERIDVRVGDSQVHQGLGCGDVISKDGQLRRGYSRRSLAFEFESWKKRKPGTLTRFLEVNKERFGSKSSGAALCAVRTGLTLLQYERMLQSSGYAAILIFHLSDCIKLTNRKNIGKVVQALRTQTCLNVFAKERAVWIDQGQRKYNSKSTNSTFTFADTPAELCEERNAELGIDFSIESKLGGPLDCSESSRQRKRQCRSLSEPEIESSSDSDDDVETIAEDQPSGCEQEAISHGGQAGKRSSSFP